MIFWKLSVMTSSKITSTTYNVHLRGGYMYDYFKLNQSQLLCMFLILYNVNYIERLLGSRAQNQFHVRHFENVTAADVSI